MGYFDFGDSGPRQTLGISVCLADEPIAQGFGYGFRLGVDLQLLVDTLHVEGDCVDAYVYFQSRGFVVVSFDE